MSDDAPPRILEVLKPLVGLVDGAEDLIFVLSQDAGLLGKLVAYTRQHGVAGLIKWLESPGDAV